MRAQMDLVQNVFSAADAVGVTMVTCGAVKDDRSLTWWKEGSAATKSTPLMWRASWTAASAVVRRQVGTRVVVQASSAVCRRACSALSVICGCAVCVQRANVVYRLYCPSLFQRCSL